jgi:hypothetical protein
MSQLTTALYKNLDDQIRHTALSDCFHSWDNEVDMDVMFGGIADRLKAMGQTITMVSFERSSLNEVNVLLDNRKAFRITRLEQPSTVFTSLYDFFTEHDGQYLYMDCEDYKNLFSKAELRKLSVWAIDNLHH